MSVYSQTTHDLVLSIVSRGAQALVAGKAFALHKDHSLANARDLKRAILAVARILKRVS